jgi:hypothetical protein
MGLDESFEIFELLIGIEDHSWAAEWSGFCQDCQNLVIT